MTRHILVFGQYKVRLFQRNDQENANWRMQVQIEGKPWKPSLGTAHLETAKQVATDKMIDVLAKIKSGQKVHSTSIKDARDAYLVDQRESEVRDNRSKFTVKKVGQRVDRAVQFLKDKGTPFTASVDSVNGKFWQQYVNWRLAPMPNIRRDGIVDELVTIRAWFEWCQAKGWCSASNLPQWELKKEKEQAKRKKIPADQIKKARGLLVQWVNATEPGFERRKRKMVNAIFQTMLNGAFRTGEIRQVQYKDVNVIDSEIVVTIQSETSKVRKTREIVLVGDEGIWLRDWLAHRSDWAADDLVFDTRFKPVDKTRPNWRQKLIANIKQTFERAYTDFRTDFLTPAGLSDIEPYHARHYCITKWILQREEIHWIAKYSGTSVAQIEKTYSGVLAVLMGREFAKKRVVHKDDGSFEVVTRK